MAATDFQMQPLDLSCSTRKEHGYPPEDLSSRRRRSSNSPPPLTTISPPPLTALNTVIHPRIRIRADLTNSREDHLISESYHIRRRTGDYEDDHDSSVSVDDKPTDLRRIVRDEINRPIGNPRKRFLSKYLHNDISVEDSLVDEGVEHDRPIHPGKRRNLIISYHLMQCKSCYTFVTTQILAFLCNDMITINLDHVIQKIRNNIFS